MTMIFDFFYCIFVIEANTHMQPSTTVAIAVCINHQLRCITESAYRYLISMQTIYILRGYTEAQYDNKLIINSNMLN